MPSAKDAITSPEKNPAVNGGAPAVQKGTEVASGATVKPATTVHRSSTAKEVIPFEWKLIGESEGFALILFKSIEREDVDAQFERVQRDGYYANLRILGADDKVKQPSSAKARQARQTAKVTKEVEAAVEARAAAEAGARAAKATKKPPAPRAIRKSTKIKTAKSVKPKVKAMVKVKAKVKAKPKAKPKTKAKSKAKPKVKAKSKRANKSVVVAKSKTKVKAKGKAKKRR